MDLFRKRAGKRRKRWRSCWSGVDTSVRLSQMNMSLFEFFVKSSSFVPISTHSVTRSSMPICVNVYWTYWTGRINRRRIEALCVPKRLLTPAAVFHNIPAACPVRRKREISRDRFRIVNLVPDIARNTTVEV